MSAAPGPEPSARWVLAVAVALAPHPALWRTAVAQVLHLAPRGWWRRRPFLPLPTQPYLAFRSQTMYGDASRLPEPADVVVYLRWCRDFPHAPATPRRGAAPPVGAKARG